MSSIEEKFINGLREQKNGNLKQARLWYLAILQDNPFHPEANYNMGVIALRLNNITLALQMFKAALHAHPENPQFSLSMIELLVRLGYFNDAKILMHKAKNIGVNHSRFDLLTEEMAAPSSTGKKDNLSVEPPEHILEHVFNTYLENQNNCIRDTVLDLLKSYPSSSRLLNLLGVISQNMGNDIDALENYDAAINSDPNFAEAYNNLGNLYKKLDKRIEAKQCYEKAIHLKDHFAEAYHNYGILLSELKEIDKAISYIEMAIDMKQNYLDAYNSLVRILVTVNPSKAEKVAKTAISLGLENATTHNCLGYSQLAQGDHEAAIVSFEHAISKDPHVAHSWYNLGLVNLKIKKYLKAEKYFRKALEVSSTYAEAHLGLAILSVELKDYSSAIQRYRDTIKHHPKNTNALCGLANILSKTGDENAAIELYKRVLELDPQHASARHLLNSLQGTTTDYAPIEYVRTLFDQYANDFETNLIVRLDYKTPKILAETIMAHCTGKIFNDTLDLGCGSGLIGLEIRNICSTLTGVDISSEMLKRANDKDCYTELINDDIINYLGTNQKQFDLILSADVFNYLGSLDTVFELVRSKLRKDGIFAFSVEHMSGDGFLLSKTGRYMHSTNYIFEVSRRTYFKIFHYQNVRLRKENDSWVDGMIYIFNI